jgi:RND superfamily putative drug exporter
MTAERWMITLLRFRWPLLATWILTVAVAGLGARQLPGLLSGGGWYGPGAQSQEAGLAESAGFLGRGPTEATILIQDARYTATDPRFAGLADEALRSVTGDPRLAVTSSYGWFTQRGDSRNAFVGRDRRTVITFAGLRLNDGTARRVLPDVQDELSRRFGPLGLKVTIVSPAAFWGEVNQLSQSGLARAELVTLPLIIVIMVALYRGIVAALISAVVGGTAVVLTLGVLAVLARRFQISIFAENAVTMIGLGVSVDYSLFMITRYQDELPGQQGRTLALAASLRTSGRAALFSAATIMLAMSSLLLTNLDAIRSIVVGVILVVGFAAMATVCVLPVILHLAGGWIRGGRHRRHPPRRAEPRPLWQRLATLVMARPVLFLSVAAAILGVLALPALKLTTFTPDVKILPQQSVVRSGYQAIEQQFGAGAADPVEVVVRSRTPLPELASQRRLEAFSDRLTALPRVAGISSPMSTLLAASPHLPFAALSPAAFSRLPQNAQDTIDHFISADRRGIVFEVRPDGYAAGVAARRLLASVRAVASGLDSPDLQVVVGGETAQGVDANAEIQRWLPAEITIMLVLSYLMLMITFRSVVLPLKAIVMNLLSVGASYGALVLVFQDGFGIGLLGRAGTGDVTNFVPLLLMATIFSLSTDYEVFLLSRIREEYHARRDNSRAVAAGLAFTAPVISGAAVLMIAVFGAFAFAGILPIQQLGFGLAFAVGIDVTVIRLIVVPASMRLLGDWNWWLPGRGAARSGPTTRSARNQG